MIDYLVNKYGRKLDEDVINEAITDYVADTCKNILINTAVFKDDEKGRSALDKFMEGVKNEIRD